MINAIVSKFISPCQIDFPDSVERSVKGAIHFRPGSTVSMTEEEFDHLLKSHSEFAKSLSVSAKKKVFKESPKVFSMDDVSLASDVEPLPKEDEAVFTQSMINLYKDDTVKIGRKKRKKKDKSIESEGKTSSD